MNRYKDGYLLRICLIFVYSVLYATGIYSLHINGLLNEEKVDVESVFSEKGSNFSVKTMVHIHKLFEKFGFDDVFGRSAVMELLELKGSGASKLLSNLVQADIIEPVSGHGKGKYKFKK